MYFDRSVNWHKNKIKENILFPFFFFFLSNCFYREHLLLLAQFHDTVDNHWGIIGDHEFINATRGLLNPREARDEKAKGRSTNEKFFEVVARNGRTPKL